MRVDAFDFDLPAELIAERPMVPREAARLLLVDGGGLRDAAIADLPDLLRPGDLMVFNDTRVIPARLRGRRGAVAVEVTLLRPEPSDAAVWRALARPARRLRPGDTIAFSGDLTAQVLGRDEAEVRLRLPLAPPDLIPLLERIGEMPLPPYIAGRRHVDARDRDDYQTVFAARPGAVAAPTAGLHFTSHLLARLADRGVESAAVTLHVGAGTFLPVKVEDTGDHRMHAEWGEVTPAAAAAIAGARARGGRLLAVGTTALRLLESAAAADGAVSPFRGETDIFITPGYRFRTADLLLTNFHLPRSTLVMLVSAFAGMGRIRAAYAHAIAARYRFYSYGDACLLQREGP